MSDFIVGILTKLAVSGAKAGLRSLFTEPPIAKAIAEAIEQTSNEFSGIEGTREHLRDWLESDSFIVMLQQMESGNKKMPTAEVVSSFTTATGFYMQEQTNIVARCILEAFANNLEAELYKSELGIAILAAREEVLHKETRDLIDTVRQSTAKLEESNSIEDKGLERTRARFAEKVADAYREFALLIICGGDSPYYHQTLDLYLTDVQQMSKDDLDKIEGACKTLTNDILRIIGSMAETSANVLSMLEHVRLSFGYAISAKMSNEFDAIIDALESLIRLAPRHPASSYSEVKPRERIPKAIIDLQEFITQAVALDASFRRLIEVSTKHAPEWDSFMTEVGVKRSIEWYEQYYVILKQSWTAIAAYPGLPEENWYNGT